MEKLMIDTDVMINWLAQEVNTDKELWSAPSTILELGEKGQIHNHISLITVFEIRFVLRRKKKRELTEVEEDLSIVQQIVNSLVPTNEQLLHANELQSKQLLEPFDSIILSQTIALEGILISRDEELLRIASQYIQCFTPEDYINSRLH